MPEPKYDRVWEQAPDPLALIESCRQGLALVPVTWAGWRLNALTCSGSSIGLTWSRERGATAQPPGSVLNDALTTASQTIPLPPLNVRGAEMLGDSAEMTKRYLSQNWSANLTKAPDDPLPPPPPGYTGPWNPPPPPWVKRSFTLVVSELPSNIPDLIADLPGVVLNTMTYAPAGISGTWSVGGVIYENRK